MGGPYATVTEGVNSRYSCDIARAISRAEPDRSCDSKARPLGQLVGVVTQTVSLGSFQLLKPALPLSFTS